jgi:cell division transport system permease protein
VTDPVLRQVLPGDSDGTTPGAVRVEQNLRELFDRALDDEPPLPPGDQAQLAMAQGSRQRRRRALGYSGVAGGLAIAVAAVVVLTTTAPHPSTVQQAAVAGPEPVCVAAGRSATDVAVFLRTDVSDAQRTALNQQLDGSPDVRQKRYETREQAFERFKVLWRDDPDFVKSVGPEALPESFRFRMAEPPHYPVLLAELKNEPGVQDVVGWSCPAGATPGAQR